MLLEMYNRWQTYLGACQFHVTAHIRLERVENVPVQGVSGTERVKAKVILGHWNFHFNFAMFVMMVYYSSHVFFVFFFIHVRTNSMKMRFFLEKLFVEDCILILELVGMLLKCELATHWGRQTQQHLTATPVKIMSWQQHVGGMKIKNKSYHCCKRGVTKLMNDKLHCKARQPSQSSPSRCEKLSKAWRCATMILSYNHRLLMGL